MAAGKPDQPAPFAGFIFAKPGDLRPLKIRDVVPQSRHARNMVRYRRRLARGQRIAKIVITNDVIEGLIESGRLDERSALDPDKVAAELAGVVETWAGAWTKNRYR